MKKYWNYLITFIVGIGIALIIWFYKGLFNSTDIRERVIILSDGCFVSGVLLTGFGLLTAISNLGNFDMITYGFHNLINLFKANKIDDSFGKTFYDYHIIKGRKRKKVSFILNVGILYMILGAVFTTIFYNQI